MATGTDLLDTYNITSSIAGVIPPHRKSKPQITEEQMKHWESTPTDESRSMEEEHHDPIARQTPPMSHLLGEALYVVPKVWEVGQKHEKLADYWKTRRSAGYWKTQRSVGTWDDFLSRALALRLGSPEPVAEDTDAKIRLLERAIESAESDKSKLEEKIRFLHHQLQSDKLHLQLYRYGAGGFLVSSLSLLVWVFTGVAAPFHPTFAALAIPVSIGVMAMGFLVRREEQKESKKKE